MVYRIGSEGLMVRKIQKIVGSVPDGFFGPITESYVKIYQAQNGLLPDGIVGPLTLTKMGLLRNCDDCLVFEQHFMPTTEYFRGPVSKHWIVLHHTAGWDDPFATINMWANDRRSRVGTEFVIGGQHPLNRSTKHDGKIVQAFPEGGYAWHTGTGKNNLHVQSVGIEICNIGWVKNGHTYVNTPINADQICTLKKPFRGYRQYHKYSDAQLDATKALLIHLGEKYNIDLKAGLVQWIKRFGADAFDHINPNFANGNHGIYSHSNLTSQKSDCFPQPELIDMLLSI